MHWWKHVDIFHRLAKAGIARKNYMSTTFNTISNLPFIHIKDYDSASGVQFTPKGGVMAPNASAYFSRCFL